jgi:hypothetical protein
MSHLYHARCCGSKEKTLSTLIHRAFCGSRAGSLRPFPQPAPIPRPNLSWRVFPSDSALLIREQCQEPARFPSVAWVSSHILGANRMRHRVWLWSGSALFLWAGLHLQSLRHNRRRKQQHLPRRYVLQQLLKNQTEKLLNSHLECRFSAFVPPVPFHMGV